MKLNSLTPINGSKTNRKRRGRGHGSGLGKSAGRGDKGAGQRSGFKRRAWFEGGQMPLQRRLPKIGFTSRKKDTQRIRLSELNFDGNKDIDINLLKERKVISHDVKKVKVFLSGDLKSKINLSGISVTKGARKAIEDLGGKIKE